jgi:hypothetical protein
MINMQGKKQLKKRQYPFSSCFSNYQAPDPFPTV